MTKKTKFNGNSINSGKWFDQHQYSGGIFMSAGEVEAALAAVPSGISENSRAREAGMVAGRFAAAFETGADKDVELAGPEAGSVNVDTIDCPETLLGWLRGWLIGYRGAVKTTH